MFMLAASDVVRCNLHSLISYKHRDELQARQNNYVQDMLYKK